MTGVFRMGKKETDSLWPRKWLSDDVFVAPDGKHYKILPCGRIIKVKKSKEKYNESPNTTQV